MEINLKLDWFNSWYSNELGLIKPGYFLNIKTTHLPTEVDFKIFFLEKDKKQKIYLSKIEDRYAEFQNSKSKFYSFITELFENFDGLNQKNRKLKSDENDTLKNIINLTKTTSREESLENYKVLLKFKDINFLAYKGTFDFFEIYKEHYFLKSEAISYSFNKKEEAKLLIAQEIKWCESEINLFEVGKKRAPPYMGYHFLKQYQKIAISEYKNWLETDLKKDYGIRSLEIGDKKIDLIQENRLKYYNKEFSPLSEVEIYEMITSTHGLTMEDSDIYNLITALTRNVEKELQINFKGNKNVFCSLIYDLIQKGNDLLAENKKKKVDKTYYVPILKKHVIGFSSLQENTIYNMLQK